MAVENSRHESIWPTEEPNESEGIPEAPYRFLCHYYHDLESVSWCFAYHTFDRVMESTWTMQEDRVTSLQALRHRLLELFPREGDSDTIRASYIREKLNLYKMIDQQQWHSSALTLLVPLKSNTIIHQALRQLSTRPQTERNPYRWPEDAFSAKPYEEFIAQFDTSIRTYEEEMGGACRAASESRSLRPLLEQLQAEEIG
jgi:hypothetical protein